MIHPKKTFSDFIWGRWYSSMGDYLKNTFSRSTIQFFLLYNSPFVRLKVTNNNKTLSLNEFFERSICGRWYIHLEHTIYHLCRLIIIPSGWSSSSVVDYDPQWLNIICSGWFKFQETTIIDDICLSWMNIVSIGWISSALVEYCPRQMSTICLIWVLSALDEYHPRQMSIICFSWISSAEDEYHAT
jgi:hypothetical protein